MKPASTPVIIVGAGPVGVTAALLPAGHGVESVLLERHHDIYPLPRAVAIDDEVCRILQTAGIGEQFMATVRPAQKLRLLDARHRVLARFDRSHAGRDGYPQTSMFSQPTLERLLRDELATRPQCDLRSGAEVTDVIQKNDGSVRVTYRDGEGTHELRAEAVLGCGGSNSLTRVTSTWSARRGTPSTPASPIAGVRAASSFSATPPISPRLSSARACAQGCATPSTSSGSSLVSSTKGPTSGYWTPTRTSANPTPAT
ncbi:hypothetical protein FNH09_46090 [Streptomyces adustus]|uniref:FAD-binding domain-containing protein n=1 Tax=Streptomyces adustus TaxID=1609272 RepID=A0A5N8VWL8_9ACTN|nr:hypothetical protein [Streptomyces adustus]